MEGRIDTAVLGGMQVSASGDLADRAAPGQDDQWHGWRDGLLHGARSIGCVQRVIADLGVIDVTGDGLILIETAPDVSVEETRSGTGAELRSAVVVDA